MKRMKMEMKEGVDHLFMFRGRLDDYTIVQDVTKLYNSMTKDCTSWKMNLLAYSPIMDMYFLATKSTIQIYKGYYNFTNNFIYNVINVNLSEGPSLGDEEFPSINHISIGNICPDREILVSVCGTGHVDIWCTDSFNNLPLESFTLSPISTSLRLFVGGSAWSIAIQDCFLAIGANNHNITVFKWKRPFILENGPINKVILRGHQHNIPGLAYSHEISEHWIRAKRKKWKYYKLASASIDSSIRIWNEKKTIKKIKNESVGWGWQVSWIKESDIDWRGERAPFVGMKDAPLSMINTNGLSPTKEQSWFMNESFLEETINWGQQQWTLYQEKMNLVLSKKDSPLSPGSRSHHHNHPSTSPPHRETIGRVEGPPDPNKLWEYWYELRNEHRPARQKIYYRESRKSSYERGSVKEFLVYLNYKDIMIYDANSIDEDGNNDPIFRVDYLLHCSTIPVDTRLLDNPSIDWSFEVLSMHQWIPELSLFLIGQQVGFVIIVHLLRDFLYSSTKDENNKDQLIFDITSMALPSTDTDNISPLLGFTCVKREQDWWTLIMLHSNGLIRSFDIKKRLERNDFDYVEIC